MSFDPNHGARFCPEATVSEMYGTFEIRELAERDLAGAAAFYLSLDEIRRVWRFHTPLDDTAILRYINGLKVGPVAVVGAADRINALMIGIAEFHPASGGELPEVTVSVAPGPRALLVATQLLSRIMGCAAMRGADGVAIDLCHEDTFMITLLRQFGARIDLMQGRAMLSWSEKAAMGRAA
ncbi:MAG: hypothetical protein RIC16_08625 [Rhodospirillales bacterium]